jgi:hypothetical protein
MKKLFMIILAIAMLATFAGISFASGGVAYSRDPGARLKSEVFTTCEGQSLSSTITTQNRILGYTVSDSAAGWGAIYDDSSASGGGVTSTYRIGEVSCSAGSSETVWFVLPVEITRGLKVEGSASTTMITVYYE